MVQVEAGNNGLITQNLTVENNVPGVNGFSQAKTQDFDILVNMPDNFTCTGCKCSVFPEPWSGLRRFRMLIIILQLLLATSALSDAVISKFHISFAPILAINMYYILTMNSALAGPFGKSFPFSLLLEEEYIDHVIFT